MSNIIPFKPSWFSGHFDLAGVETQFDRNQRRYFRLLLLGADMSFTALAWPDQYAGPGSLSPGVKVNVTGILRGDQLPVCKTIMVVGDPMVVRLNSLAVCRLSMMRGWLDAPALNAFCKALWRSEELFWSFLGMPASRHHHHSYRGGLFVHSVDVALRMFGSSSIALEDKPLAVAAGLAHDLGKTVSGPGFGDERHHDKLALLALAPLLDVLRSSHPEFVDDLKLIFCLRQENRRPTDIPRRIDILLEELLRADHLSCAEGWDPGSSNEPSQLDD